MITPANIATALGLDTPDTGSTTWNQWALWITDADMLIQHRADDLDTEVDAAKRDYVIREAVVAHVKRPDDATQVTISVDDGQTSKAYRSGKGRVTILDEWWTMLGLTDPNSAFSFDTINRSTTDPIRAFLTATDTTW